MAMETGTGDSAFRHWLLRSQMIENDLAPSSAAASGLPSLPRMYSKRARGGSVRFTLRMGSGPSHARSSSLPANSASTISSLNQCLAKRRSLLRPTESQGAVKSLIC
jgi:hypothetical protein